MLIEPVVKEFDLRDELTEGPSTETGEVKVPERALIVTTYLRLCEADCGALQETDESADQKVRSAAEKPCLNEVVTESLRKFAPCNVKTNEPDAGPLTVLCVETEATSMETVSLLVPNRIITDKETFRLPRDPCNGRQRVVESDSQFVLSHADCPNLAICVYITVPIPAPCIVMLTVPLAATFSLLEADTLDRSTEKIWVKLPEIPPDVNATLPVPEVAALSFNVTEVSDCQLLHSLCVP
mmetsp:Transcript_58206/g.153050  ORF Transcript_58206/g.153050 Transcript_58206/m.153050 type:complete len:240 (-) Transcript_58206:795-1514(-)